MASCGPVLPQCCSETQLLGGLFLTMKGIEGGAEVFVLRVELRDDGSMVLAEEPLLGCLGELQEVEAMAQLDRRSFRAEQIERVLAHGLQDREAGLASRIDALYQARVDERREPLQWGAADDLCGLDAEATREDREACHVALFVLVEQVEAPVERRLQRLLAGGEIAPPACEERQARLEPVEQFDRRERADVAGGELDRER